MRGFFFKYLLHQTVILELHSWVIPNQITQYFLGSHGDHLRFFWNLAEEILSATEMNPENFCFLSQVGLEFIHWILCNFPIFRWSWHDSMFSPNLRDNYILTKILFSLKLYTPVVSCPNYTFWGSVLADSDAFQCYRYSKLA